MSVVQQLPIRSRYRGPAFRAIEAVLREYGPLAEVVKTWSTREGEPGEMADPSTGMFPMIHLTPVPKPSEILSVDATKVNFAVAVEMFVPGTCVDDILALWELVEDAIEETRPFRDTTVGKYLACSTDTAPSGVRALRPFEPAFSGVSRVNPGSNAPTIYYQTGTGNLTCWLRRPA